MESKNEKEWWQAVFNERYLATNIDIITPQRTIEETSLIVKKLHLKKNAKILDLACGHGRHAIALARYGYQVTGFDQSNYFLKLAQTEAKKQGVSIRFIRGDMRKLPFRNAFDAVINMFTSLGYFQKEPDHKLVIQNIALALKTGGQFLIDLANMFRVLVNLGLDGQIDRKTKNLFIKERKKLSNGIVLKRIETFNPETARWKACVVWKDGSQKGEYQYSVRLFHLPELTELLEKNHFRITGVWGNFRGGPYNLQSPRLIVRAQKI